MANFIYYISEGPTEELRWSLRSLATHADVDQLSVVGSVPDWVDTSNIEMVEGNVPGSRFANSLWNIRAASLHDPGEFYIMMDDIILLKTFEHPLPYWYWRPISEHMRVAQRDPKSQPRKEVFARTLLYLQSLGISDPNHYELHVPMRINGSKMLDVLDSASYELNYDNPPIWRTLYANLVDDDSAHIQRSDVKHHSLSTFPEDSDFLSTDERSFDKFIPYLSEKFPEPSPWEKQ